MIEYDVVVIGAGAAGLMCAISAGRRGRRVLVMDHGSEAGAKILISGGGRCNFTNIETVPDRFLSENAHFCRSALDRYTPDHFVAMVKHHGIAFHEKALGQLFCTGSARAIVGMLMAECAAFGVDLRLAHRVTDISRTDMFRVQSDRGLYASKSLVLATGGLSIPKLGATGFAHDVARQFGLRLTEVKPGLVPLTFADELLALMQPLSGVSVDSEVTKDRHRFRGGVLFTHRGLSGPAILQISSYWRQGSITLNILPGMNVAQFLLDRKRASPRVELRTVLAEVLPKRLAQALTATSSIIGQRTGRRILPDTSNRMADLPDQTLRDLASRLSEWRIEPSGSEGYAKAEVTCGGVDTRDLSSRTMQANSVPGLFFVGEAVDVTGWLGGYNFQWAWASGWCAGEAA
jgi:predicted Rossmann fold flavoprotein